MVSWFIKMFLKLLKPLAKFAIAVFCKIVFTFIFRDYSFRKAYSLLL